jgi:hypothetical protein
MEFHSIVMKTRYWLGTLTNLHRLPRLATYYAIHFHQTRKYDNSIFDAVKTYTDPHDVSEIVQKFCRFLQ